MSRALWKGDISFGLVTVPVGLYTVERDTDIHFHRVTPDGSCRLRQKLYCPETEKEYDFGEATRGYEIAPGEYVILDKAELDALRPESGNTIDISSFIKLADIDPIYFQRTYLLAPEKRGQKPYQLLVKAMQEKEMAAIVKFTMRANQYLGALRVYNETYLALETMHFADEISEELPELIPEKVSKSELKLAEQLIDALVAPFDPLQYSNEYRDRLAELLEKKSEDQSFTLHPKKRKRPGKVVDFMSALKKSVEQHKNSSTKGKRKRTSKKKRASG